MAFFSRPISLCVLLAASISAASATPCLRHKDVDRCRFQVNNNGAIIRRLSKKPYLGANSNQSLIVPRGGQQDDKRHGLELTTKFAVLLGMLLAFNSGYINGACLSGLLATDKTKQAAAAVTGAWTNSALGFASGNLDQFSFNAKCILSYMSGSMISGVLNPNPIPFEVAPRSVSPAFLLGSALMFSSSAIAGEHGWDNKPFIYLAAIANGIQNSITSSITSNLVRSAHFSGITSDMGTFLGQVVRGNNQNMMKLKVNSLLATSFWIGGLVSYVATNSFSSASLLFSAALYLVIGVATAFAC